VHLSDRPPSVENCDLEGFVQSANLKPLTRENSFVLLVTSTAPRLTAVPAISRSMGPMILPRASNPMRMRDDSRAPS